MRPYISWRRSMMSIWKKTPPKPSISWACLMAWEVTNGGRRRLNRASFSTSCCGRTRSIKWVWAISWLKHALPIVCMGWLCHSYLNHFIKLIPYFFCPARCEQELLWAVWDLRTWCQEEKEENGVWSNGMSKVIQWTVCFLTLIDIFIYSLCKAHHHCQFWTFFPLTRECHLKNRFGACGMFPAMEDGVVSGPKECTEG